MNWSGSLAAGLALVALSGCGTFHRHYAGPLIVTPPSCADIAFPIYFDPGSAAVTREAERVIASARHRLTGCQVTGVEVTGLADASGAPGANLELSERRADAVTKALGRNGFGDAPVRVDAAGASGSVTAAGEARPLRRRADVTIHLMPTTSAH